MNDAPVLLQCAQDRGTGWREERRCEPETLIRGWLGVRVHEEFGRPDGALRCAPPQSQRSFLVASVS